ncbi:MAG: cell division protein SepF [Acidimicrobiaceae bacterium]|nr:cell division protein SepF [Acidimicrobiaceae bacterium]
MASGIVRKAMVYLGLTDDEYEEYDPYEDAAALAPQPAPRRAEVETGDPSLGSVSVRPVARSDLDPSNGGVAVTARPTVMRPVAAMQSPKVQVVAPRRFADAQEIGDRFKGGQPVIVNLQNNERELARRMIDFCSGVTYALAGSMDKVADQVFLLTPSNVEVSAEEKRRLEERGYSS